MKNNKKKRKIESFWWLALIIGMLIIINNWTMPFLGVALIIGIWYWLFHQPLPKSAETDAWEGTIEEPESNFVPAARKTDSFYSGISKGSLIDKKGGKNDT